MLSLTPCPIFTAVVEWCLVEGVYVATCMVAYPVLVDHSTLQRVCLSTIGLLINMLKIIEQCLIFNCDDHWGRYGDHSVDSVCHVV
jgi:hypothetical protein